MSKPKPNTITCDRCGHFTFDPPDGLPHCRTYDGRDVCVSCLVVLKHENGDYSDATDNR